MDSLELRNRIEEIDKMKNPKKQRRARKDLLIQLQIEDLEWKLGKRRDDKDKNNESEDKE